MIPKNMKFACLVKAGQAEIRERALAELQDHDVLLNMQSCNICTTDYQQWLGLREHQGYPMAGGHEACGIVVAVGAKVHNLKPGDKVATGYAGCGVCEACRNGDIEECSCNQGVSVDGYQWGFFGFSDYVVKPVQSVYKVKSTLNSCQAGFLEPLATVIHGMKKLRVKPFETIVIIGAGTMGLVNAQAARAYGARVIITELLEKKLQVARSMGFEVIDGKEVDAIAAVMELTEGYGADAVIVAVGNTKAYAQGFAMLKQKDGRFLVFAAGYPAPEMNIDPNAIHYRRIEIIGTFSANNEDFVEAAKALSNGSVDVSELIEQQSYTLDSIQEAFQAASQPGMFRVSVLLDT